MTKPAQAQGDNPILVELDGPAERLTRAQLRAYDRLRATVSITDLARLLAIGTERYRMGLPIGRYADDVVNRILPRHVVNEAMGPSQAIVRDAFVRGGRVGAELVKRALGGKS